MINMIILPIISNLNRDGFKVISSYSNITTETFMECYITKGMVPLVKPINFDTGEEIIRQNVVAMPSTNSIQFQNALSKLEYILKEYKPSKIRWFIPEELKNLIPSSFMETFDIDIIDIKEEVFHLYVYTDEIFHDDSYKKKIDQMLCNQNKVKVYSDTSYESRVEAYSHIREYEYENKKLKDFLEDSSIKNKGVILFGKKEKMLDLIALCNKYKVRSVCKSNIGGV